MGIFGKNIILNEVYFGKNKRILKAFEQFSILRQKYIGRENENINIDPDMIKFNRLIEEVFGFYSFALVIEPGPTFNAFTVPVSYQFDKKVGREAFVADKEGFRYLKKYKYSTSVFVYSSLFCDERFTDGEIFAIVLHEIGHNFSGAISKYQGLYKWAIKICNMLSIVSILLQSLLNPIIGIKFLTHLQSDLVKWYNEIYTNIKTKKMADDLYKFKYLIRVMQGIAFNIISVPDMLLSVVMMPRLLIKAIEKNLYRFLNPSNLVELGLLPSSILDENVSDDFAAMYGFAPELNSALDKMVKFQGGIATREMMSNIPIFGHMYHLIMIPYEFLSALLDEHPSNEARLNGSIQYLKSELDKKKIDPKLKKEMESELSALETQLDKELRKAKISDTRYFRKIYGYIMYLLVGGDIKNLLTFHKSAIKDFDASYELGNSRLNELDRVKIK